MNQCDASSSLAEFFFDTSEDQVTNTVTAEDVS